MTEKKRRLSRHTSLAERLEHHSMPEPNSGCVLWIGAVVGTKGSARRGAGYGRMMRLGKVLAAHRVAWELKNGPIPKGLVVMHKCDNPGCVNPLHLEVGTQAQNMRDKIARGRGRPANQYTASSNPSP